MEIEVVAHAVKSKELRMQTVCMGEYAGAGGTTALVSSWR